MKKTIAGIIMGLMVVFAAPALAANIISEEKVATVAQGQTVDDDLFISGETVVIDGIVNGDLYAAAERVTINGTVNGDVYVVSSNIEIRGSVRDDLVAAGQTIAITGPIGDGITVVGETITAEKSASIGGGVLAAAGKLILRPAVGRGITAAAGETTLDGVVGRSVFLASNTITLNSGTNINGDLKYRSEESLVKNQGAQVSGQSVRIQDDAMKAGNQNAVNVGWLLWSFLSLAIIGLILFKLMPTALPGVAGAMLNKPLPVLGWGVAVLFLTPPLLILMLLSIIGIPAAILAFVLFLITLYLSQIFVALAVGNLISRSMARPAGSFVYFLIGLAALLLVGLIPVVGGITGFITIILGLGGVSYYAKSRLGGHPKSTKAT